MQALTFVEPGKVEFREAPAPTLRGPKEALVRPIAVARCDLDWVIARGRAPAPGPFPLGHEQVTSMSERSSRSARTCAA